MTKYVLVRIPDGGSFKVADGRNWVTDNGELFISTDEDTLCATFAEKQWRSVSLEADD